MKKFVKSSLFVKNKDDFIDDNCKKCRDKIQRESPDYKSVIVIKNGSRYKIFQNAGPRKLCKLETCTAVSCGDFCRKHKPQTINFDEKQCQRCLSIKQLSYFKKDDVEYQNCTNCRNYKKKRSLDRHHLTKPY